MRSILKFILVALITILIPAIILSIAYTLGLSELWIIMAQFIIIMVYVAVFTALLKLQRKYEADTLEFINATRSIDELKKIRDDRVSHKSKADVTSKILSIEYSYEEAVNLRKYASSPADMEHYFSALIDNSSGEKRAKYRAKRDAYMTRHGRKIHVYPDFNENLKTAAKWVGFFFLSAIIYNLVPNLVTDETFLVGFVMLGMLILAVIMIMAILWIVRTLISYWNKDMV